MTTTDPKDPITAYLAMHIDLINEADDVQGVRLQAWHASGYVQALYDIERIQAVTLTKHREDIERVKQARLEALTQAEG
jgi:hypothetical protein